MTIILAIESSTDGCSVALRRGKEIWDRFVIAPRQHTDLLLPMMQEILAEAQLSLSALDAIAFGQGPGSFMGVRLATGVAQGLAFGIDRPVVPVSSLQALAQQGAETFSSKAIVAAWDARMNEIYWGCYVQDEKNILQPFTKESVSAPKSIVLPQGHPWILIGNAWQVYKTQLNVLPPSSSSQLLYPRAREIAILGAFYFESGCMLSAEYAAPQYIREEVAWKKDDKA